MSRGFKIVDFDVEQPSGMSNDDWIACLNVIRRKFCEAPELARHGLCAHLVVYGEGDDAEIEIGIVLPTTKYFGHFDTDSVISVFEDWRRTNQLEDLLKEAPKYGVPNWMQLLAQKVYPVDQRDL